MQFQQRVTSVPERWQVWAEKCRAQAPASRKWFTCVLSTFDESAARWIEDAVPDSWRAMRLAESSDDDARSKIIEGLVSSSFSLAEKKGMVSAWLCRDYHGAADAAAQPQVPLAV